VFSDISGMQNISFRNWFNLSIELAGAIGFEGATKRFSRTAAELIFAIVFQN
jgi:hypothetical protein